MRSRSAAAVAALVVFALSAAASGASAQTGGAPVRPSRPAPHAGSVEIGGGFAWGGGIDFGEARAELVRNPGTGAGSTYDLFGTSTSLGAGIGAQAQLGVYLSPALAVEAGFRWLRPELSTDISDDVEAVEDVTATERLNQYVFGGSVVWHFTGAAFGGGRGVPFVAGGAGYLRDLHEGNELVETGVEYHATGGVKYWFASAPRRAGMRAEAGVSVRDGGFDLQDGTRLTPVASVSIVYLF